MDLSFRSVLNAIHSKTKQSFVEALGIKDIYSEELFNKLNEYIFPKRPKNEDKKSFDYDIDFRLLWADFKAEYNIDLINDNINWWEFTALFERMTLLEGISAVSKVSGYRQQKLPKRNKNNQEQIKHIRSMKARYRLENVENESVGNFINSMFRKARAKAKKEGVKNAI